MDLVKMSHLQRGELVIDDVVYRNVMYFPEEDPYTAIDTACAALISLIYKYQSRLSLHQVDVNEMLCYRVKRKFCDAYRARNAECDMKVIVMNSGQDDIFNTCFAEKESALSKIWKATYPYLFIDEFFAKVFHHNYIKPLENHYFRHISDSYASTVDVMQMGYSDPKCREITNETDGFNTAITECRGLISLHLKDIIMMSEYFKNTIHPMILQDTPEDPKMPLVIPKEMLLPDITMNWFNWVAYYEALAKGHKIHSYNGLLYEISDGTWKWRALFEPINGVIMGKTLLSHVCTVSGIDTASPKDGILYFNRNINEITFDTYEHAIDFLKI